MRNLLKEKFLLFRIRAKKDPDAFGEIYDTYVSRIHRYIFFKVPTQETAEDLTSETFLRTWNYLKEKREVPNLQALLYSVARSVIVDYYRASVAEREVVSIDAMTAAGRDIPAGRDPRRTAEGKIDADAVLEKIRGLKDEYREALVMKHLDGMTTAEIAAALGKSASNVRVLLHRATKALADATTNEREGAPEHFAGNQ